MADPLTINDSLRLPMRLCYMGLPLHRLFALVGAFALIGPHTGHDAELLLGGSKPIGLFCIFNSPRDGLSDDEKRDIDDVARLDAAVDAGLLSKCTVHIPRLNDGDGPDGTAHFFCQKGREEQMQELANYHKAIWDGCGEDRALPKNIGLYFGYTAEDVSLFQQGGYDSLPLAVRFLMKSTHTLRKAARLESLRQATKATGRAPMA